MPTFLHVSGGDYSAMDFERNYNPQQFYEDMVIEDVTATTISKDEMYADVKIMEFGDVDRKFMSFVFNEFVDYEQSKHSNLIEVERVIVLRTGGRK